MKNQQEKPPLIIVSGRDPLQARGGYEAHAANIAHIATQLGYIVHSICIAKETTTRNTTIGVIHALGSPWYRLPILRCVEMAGLVFFSHQITRCIYSILANDSRGIVWGIGPWTIPAIATRTRLKGKRVRVFADYFSSIPHEFRATRAHTIPDLHGWQHCLALAIAARTIVPLYVSWEKKMLRAVDGVITHYASTEHVLAMDYQIPTSRFFRVPYAVDMFQRYSDDDARHAIFPPKPWILSVARHEGRKGIQYLLQALALVQAKGIRCGAVIIGDGKLLHAHRALVKRLRLVDVYLPGSFPGPRPYYQNATLFVHPAVEEGSSSLAVLDAMKWGLPVIVTAVDGLVEDVEDSVSGILVPPANPQALAGAIIALLTQPDKMKSLGRQAKKQYEKLHGEQQVSTSIARFLQSAL